MSTGLKMKGSSEADASNGAKENNPHVVIETTLTEKVGRLSQITADSCCIHRVPPRLRLVCEKAYTPQVVSIGPLHHGKETLKAMEEHKLRYLQYFLDRRNNLSLKDCIQKIKYQEVTLRSCYSETIQLNSDEFVEIILVDAIFLIGYLFRQLDPENERDFGEPPIAEDAWLDLLMLENQLPFFILEDLLELDIFPDKSLSIMSLSIPFLAARDRGVYRRELESKSVQHFVDLLRSLYIAPLISRTADIATSGSGTSATVNAPNIEELSDTSGSGTSATVKAPNIEELHRAGVKLKVSSSNSLFDIQFKVGILKIPKLEIVDSTQIILRNLIAYEQCLSVDERYICQYVAMLDQLVDTPKDVGLLDKYGIVENYLGGGNDELSTMINCIATGVGINPEAYYYGPLCDDLNKYCKSNCNRFMADLKQDYCNTPWRTISVIAAAVLLLLTLIQTVCSVASLL